MASHTKKAKTTWSVPASKMAANTFNPIRNIVDTMNLTPHPDKPMIALSIGDPTVFGNLPLPDVTTNAVKAAIDKGKYDGYGPSVGYEESRKAIAEYVSTDTSTVEAKDIILASGASGALDLCISCLANAGDNILVPRPGFSLYKTLAESLGIEVRHYDLIPSKSWQVDLPQMTSLIDARTRALVTCNPSNPCGSVYPRSHLEAILTVAEAHKIPIIADEIYEHFVFSGQEYHSLASLSKQVPILACGGLTKRYLVPGWRLGWIVINDRNNAFDQGVRGGLTKLSQRILGPNTLIQAAVPDILRGVPQSFYTDTLTYIENNAKTFYAKLSSVPGLTPVMPQGAMYMMVGIDIQSFPTFKSDVDFTERMISEQSVFCLPASCFEYPNYFRVVLTVPTDKVTEACTRMVDFCAQHYKPNNGVDSNHNHTNGK